MAAVAAVLGLIGWSFTNTSDRRRVNLLRGLDLKSSLNLGQWTSSSGVLRSPADGPAVLCLWKTLPAEYRLDLTVLLIQGNGWSIVSTAEPEFAVDFATIAVEGTEQQPAQTQATRNWPGDWGDLFDDSPRRFQITVQGGKLTLGRAGEQVAQWTFPASGSVEVNSSLSPAAQHRPGLYVTTAGTGLEFSEIVLTNLSENPQSP